MGGLILFRDFHFDFIAISPIFHFFWFGLAVKEGRRAIPGARGPS
jgi:hypothetical protein